MSLAPAQVRARVVASVVVRAGKMMPSVRPSRRAWMLVRRAPLAICGARRRVAGLGRWPTRLTAAVESFCARAEADVQGCCLFFRWRALARDGAGCLPRKEWPMACAM
jgi:hypothetical protein